MNRRPSWNCVRVRCIIVILVASLFQNWLFVSGVFRIEHNQTNQRANETNWSLPVSLARLFIRLYEFYFVLHFYFGFSVKQSCDCVVNETYCYRNIIIRDDNIWWVCVELANPRKKVTSRSEEEGFWAFGARVQKWCGGRRQFSFKMWKCSISSVDKCSSTSNLFIICIIYAPFFIRSPPSHPTDSLRFTIVIIVVVFPCAVARHTQNAFVHFDIIVHRIQEFGGLPKKNMFGFLFSLQGAVGETVAMAAKKWISYGFYMRLLFQVT